MTATQAPDDPVLTAQEAADYLGVNIETFREKVRAGEYPGARLGGTGPIRVRRSVLQAFVDGTWTPTP